MTPERKKFVVLSSPLICGMIVCAFFMLSHSPHRSAFHVAFDGLTLLNFLLLISFNKNRPQPDTLIHLFPASPDNLKETPNS